MSETILTERKNEQSKRDTCGRQVLDARPFRRHLPVGRLLSVPASGSKDPQAYLADVLQRIPSMINRDDLAALLPANWQPA